MKSNNRNFLGVWLPREVYLDKKLSWTEKILYVEIQSLDNEQGCFASNDYFAEFLDVSTTTISLSISKLKKLNYIECVSFDGRKRILKSAFKKQEKQHLIKPKGRVKENLKDNNTTNNSINNSTNIIIREQNFINKVSLLKYDLDLKNEFCNYWTEKNSSGKKMKYELQKTFEVKRRLETWEKNSKKWNQNTSKKTINTSMDSYLKAKQKLMGN